MGGPRVKIIDQINAEPETLHANPWNPNAQTERVQEATRESIATFGFIDPVTVRPHPEIDNEYQIIDGEHRWRAATDLGLKQIAVLVVDADDTEAKKLTIILNETRGQADKVDVAGILAGLQDELGDALGLGLPYTEEELDGLLKLADFDFDQFTGSGGGSEPDPDDTWSTLHVRVPTAVLEVWEAARDKAEESFTGEPHAQEPVRNGIALETILADFLAG